MSRAECYTAPELRSRERGKELPNKLPKFLDAYSERVELVDGSLGKSGRIPELESTEVHAPGGGAFSGPKWVTVEGALRDNGREAALGAGPGA